MKPNELGALSIDELHALRLTVLAELKTRRIELSEKLDLLETLDGLTGNAKPAKAGRPPA